MTNDTKIALQQATEAITAARDNADQEKRVCLAQIASELPARAAEVAKRIALEQPEVTKALGKEGIAELRADLQTAAEDLGRQFVAATDEIDWPLGTSYSKVDNRHVHSALFNRFYGRTGALTKVLTTHGYNTGQSEPFLPQYLYTESSFTPLAAALTALGVATESFQMAKRADDDATVDNLWGD
ncbi:hypothetical protein ACI3KS_11495 [Microbacterium sp. ZW T5_45]|uniref:hypothetical protein n=1 Tax=Microbacterium sp. ZW T5_45 TaxID=3378080 RepID=UPI003854A496